MQLIRQGNRIYNLDHLIQANFNDQGGPPRLVMLFTNSWEGESWEIELRDDDATAMWFYLCHWSVPGSSNIATASS